MSLKQTLDEAIGNIFNNYVKLIAEKYTLDKSELLALWNSDKMQSNVPIPKIKELDPEYLLKCKKPELKALCKQKGVRCTGTKAQLISLLRGGSSTKETSTKKTSKKSSGKKSDKTPKLIKNMVKKVPVIAIRKNQYGNHEHPETHLVFDNKLKKAIGVQGDDGSIKALTKHDIDICNKFKFSYVLPSNLDSDTKLEDEMVEELEEELEDELEDELEEELEDELEDELEEEDEDVLYEEYEEEYEEEDE
jgi:hypothetical protein